MTAYRCVTCGCLLEEVAGPAHTAWHDSVRVLFEDYEQRAEERERAQSITGAYGALPDA